MSMGILFMWICTLGDFPKRKSDEKRKREMPLVFNPLRVQLRIMTSNLLNGNDKADRKRVHGSKSLHEGHFDEPSV